MARIRLISLLRAVVFGATVLGATAGCATYRSELQRGQRYYDEQQYETALALWRDLETDQGSLENNERVHYSYLRGMTDYRLGYRPDARYWLGLADAGEKLTPASLSSDEKDRLGKTLDELNQDVYHTGPAASGSAVPGSTGEEHDMRQGPDSKGAPSAQPKSKGEAAGQSCNWSSECPGGYICQDRVCIEL